MDEFRWIRMFLYLMIQTAVSVTEDSMFMKVGDGVTLPCLNVINEQNNCDGTTWIFTSRNKPTVELITLGQIGEEDKTKSDRLSVTANCSLVIKKLTAEDGGLFVCQQYKLGETRAGDTLVHDSFVELSVITLTEHKDTDKVTLSCSVVTYRACRHTVRWLIEGRDVDKDDKQIVTSQTDCSATVSFLESHDIYPSRYYIMKCEVTDTNTRVQLFTFNPQPSGGETGGTKTTKKPFRKIESSTKSETTTTIKSPSEAAIHWFIIPAVGFVSLLIIVVVFIRWKRTKGNKTQMDEDAGLSLNPAETQSAPQSSQGWADPEVSYATISYSKNTNGDTRIQGDDDSNVTYSTVKAPSSSPATTADPNNLYSTVNFPIT